jgi:hypothetical protein
MGHGFQGSTRILTFDYVSSGVTQNPILRSAVGRECPTRNVQPQGQNEVEGSTAEQWRLRHVRSRPILPMLEASRKLGERDQRAQRHVPGGATCERLPGYRTGRAFTESGSGTRFWTRCSIAFIETGATIPNSFCDGANSFRDAFVLFVVQINRPGQVFRSTQSMAFAATLDTPRASAIRSRGYSPSATSRAM